MDKRALRWILAAMFMLAAGLLLAVNLLFLAGMVYPFYKYGLPIFDTSDTPVPKGRNVIELVYFLANSIVAIFTPIVLYLGVRQLRHGENARKASTYLEINKRFADDAITSSRNHIFLLEERSRTEARQGETTSQYIDRVLQQYRASSMRELASAPAQRTRYGRSLAFLLYIEEIGVLVSRGYLDEEDCFEFMGGIIVRTEELLREHIKFLRADDPHTLAHALRLMEHARRYRHRQVRYDKGAYRVERLARITRPRAYPSPDRFRSWLASLRKLKEK